MSSNHIMVHRNFETEPLEIPLDPDNSISLWKLTAVMGREVLNLKYIVHFSLTHDVSLIEWKILSVFNNRVQPPENGWDSHPGYYCVTRSELSPGTQSEEPNQSQPENREYNGDGLEELSAKALCNEYEINGFCTSQLDNHCDLIHGDECDFCHQFSLHPFSEVQRRSHLRECVENTLDETDSKICAICWENLNELFPTDTNPTPFGLLDCCEHVYCVGCIKKWEEEGNQTCPECRKNFNLVIPCDHFNVNQDEKLLLIREEP